eukprot:3407714-Rhodomonas_salina.2
MERREPCQSIPVQEQLVEVGQAENTLIPVPVEPWGSTRCAGGGSGVGEGARFARHTVAVGEIG